MKQMILSIVLGMFGAGSAPAAPEPSPQPTVKQIAGSYYRGDGTGYNVTIDFNDSGRYTATWQGCLGEYGTARGTWNVARSIITLKPTTETGHFRQRNE